MNKQLHIYDCLTSKHTCSNSAFITIGAQKHNTISLAMRAKNAGSFVQQNGNCHFFPHSDTDSYILNGKTLKEDIIITPNKLYLMTIAASCLVCWFGADDAKVKPRFENFKSNEWFIFQDHHQEWTHGMTLKTLAEQYDQLPAESLVSFRGLGNYGFRLVELEESLSFYLSNYTQKANPDDLKARAPFRCPTCWESFLSEKALAIAAHPDLCAEDDQLGEFTQIRFEPEHYNGQNLPLDSMGVPCTDFACPLCHHKLPPFFYLTRQHIFSLVGVPAAGKTYYLASLVHELSRQLPREFNIPFRDADPQANAALSDMSSRLFSARTPQEAYIGKTRLEGSLYQKVWRHGHEVSMPRPFIYNLNKASKTYSIVMFDNAGESFEPGRSGEEHPGAEHLGVASSVLYLFDPTTNPGFRNLLRDNRDPQLQRCLHPAGRQGRLLAETEMRMRTRLNMPPGTKLKTPFALIIGKCDTWQHLLGPEPLLPIVRHGVFHPQHVDANSARLRKFLFEICPYICTNAEAISENVRYFAASSFGDSPIEFTDERGLELIGPASGIITPLHVTDPVLWALNEIEPSLLPTPPDLPS